MHGNECIIIVQKYMCTMALYKIRYRCDQGSTPIYLPLCTTIFLRYQWRIMWKRGHEVSRFICWTQNNSVILKCNYLILPFLLQNHNLFHTFFFGVQSMFCYFVGCKWSSVKHDAGWSQCWLCNVRGRDIHIILLHKSLFIYFCSDWASSSPRRRLKLIQ